ncbi:MAG: alpha-L-fucosidase [Bacteroidaceae bacterium]|nr:alpha-L-fucosidase [Bacteroidaceae bacterium]
MKKILLILWLSLPIGSISAQESKEGVQDIWNLPPLPIEQGDYTTAWDNLSRRYNVPAWWREAKLGAWSHWDPQSMAEDGDWYARSIYIEGHPQARYHREHYGHPSEYGYKELCRDWKTDRWNPDELMQLYRKMGARYFLAMGNHHDNFDCWDSKYQPWNSVNVGPNQDIVGIWAETARRYDMPFGIGFHNTPARTWGQFMTVRYTSDKNGDKKGVPYDAMLTLEDGYKPNADGTEKWWKGMDPQDLYGPEHHNGRNSLDSPFANQFMWRVDDAIRRYQPDMIYFDDHAGDSQEDLGINMGLGRLTPQIIANFYNIASKRKSGNREVVATFKGVGGRYNSFQRNPEMVNIVDRSLVKSTELYTEDDIMAFPFQTEVSLQEWHYQQGARYRSASEIVTRLMQNVSRNGCLLLNITQHGRGDIDPEARQICLDFGRWIEINSEAIYSARPFDVWGNEHVIYTRQGGYIYATILHPATEDIVLQPLSTQSPSVGKILKVEMLENGRSIPFKQSAEGLTIQIKQSVTQGITNQELAQGFKVLRITHDKTWFNDDDPGVRTYGWNRTTGKGTGDFNNDISFSDQVGDRWSVPFSGKRISIIAPTGEHEGRMQIVTDGKACGEVAFHKGTERKAQQVVFTSNKLKKGKHTLELVNLEGTIAVDALKIE